MKLTSGLLQAMIENVEIKNSISDGCSTYGAISGIRWMDLKSMINVAAHTTLKWNGEIFADDRTESAIFGFFWGSHNK